MLNLCIENICMEQRVIVVGAGLCGSLLALYLAQKGYHVHVYEKRSDPRVHFQSKGRSINLALSDRGLAGLKLVGLDKKALEISIPMKGRQIHSAENSKLSFLPYSGREQEWINSISRQELNHILLNEVEKFSNVNVFFNHECVALDTCTGTLSMECEGNMIHTKGEVIFGTDGANSAVRQAFLKQSAIYQFNYSQQFLEAGYKELEIPPSDSDSFRLEKNALHIWPRDGFMMIALPNLDKSFTVTLFMPLKGELSFENLNTSDRVISFFKTHFPDAYEQMPNLSDDFFNNPTSSLHTVKCFPWQVEGKCVLLGDAAHAVVPFYGQGMNASFEDVLVLSQIIEENSTNFDWKNILELFQVRRKQNTDAIADLAVDNFYEMRDATADPFFHKKRQLEIYLEQNHPEYFSKYSLVTFREDLSYYQAMTQGRKQDKFLMEFVKNLPSDDSINYNLLLEKIRLL